MEKLSRKKSRKPAELKTGDYTKKEKEKQEKEKEWADKFSRIDLENIPESLNEFGVKYYKLLIDQLKNLSLINDLDKPSLTNLAFILGVLEQSHIHVKQNDLLIPSNTGLKPNPSLRIIKDYTTLFMNLAKSMALTPEMRQYMQKLTEENSSQYASDDNVDFLNNMLEGKFGNG